MPLVIRVFDQKTEKEKIFYLLQFIFLALAEPEEERKRWRTDIYGIAKQYGENYNVTRKDFDLIKGLTIEQVINKIL